MRAHCRKLATLVEHHESRATTAENSLALINKRQKSANRHNEEYVEIIRVPRRGNQWWLMSQPAQSPTPREHVQL